MRQGRIGSRRIQGFLGCVSLVLATCVGLSLLQAVPGFASSPSQVGRWVAPRNWPVVAIHSIVLPTGEVLQFTYSNFYEEHPGSKGAVWNPDKDRFHFPFNFYNDFFCSGHTVLEDGRVFVAGGWVQGASCDIQGPNETYLFDPWTGVWSSGPDMKRGRYYPSNLTLGDGRVLIFAGEDAACQRNALVEVFDPRDDSLEILRGAEQGMDPYPRVHLLSDGRVAKVGPEDRTLLLDPEARTWTPVTRTQLREPRFQGTSWLVPGTVDEIMTCGGFTSRKKIETLPTDTCERISFKHDDPKWQFTRPMRYPRAHANAVILPDGTVLLVGGGHHDLYDQPIHLPELYDPETNIWRVLPRQAWGRMYHSTAVVLPDGRVLSAGQDDDPSGLTGSGARAEIYEPPYLFRGARPVIKKAPEASYYGQTIRIKAKQAKRIEKAVLLRPGAVTHSVNMEQRYVSLEFAWRGAKRMDLELPDNPNLAPPGYYMLYLLNDRGAVSRAKMVHLEQAPTE